MNSAAPPHQHAAHHHHAHQQLVFGQLPPASYDNTAGPAPITVDTSSPPLGYAYSSQPPHQSSAHNGRQQRGPGSIKWTKEGVSTSAERRLPFVHRFRPVGLPPPPGLSSAVVTTQQQQLTSQQQQQTYQLSSTPLHATVTPKVLAKMSQYDTNPVGALQERYQSRGILPT